MAVWTLAAMAAVHAVSAFAFFLVGRLLARRAVQEGARLPRAGFALWWLCMGTHLALQSILHALASVGVAPLGLHLAFRALVPALLSVAVWGLAAHLVYLLTGKHRLALPLAVLFFVVGIAFYAASFHPVPTAVRTGAWIVDLEGTGVGLLYRAVYVVVGLVPIVASLAYLGLLPRVHARPERYRIVLVAGGILLWVASGLAARLGGGDLAKSVTLAVFGLGAALGVLLAYHPPPVAARWLAEGPAERAARRSALGRRVRELV